MAGYYLNGYSRNRTDLPGSVSYRIWVPYRPNNFLTE
jgi:hypothetical protein